MRLKGQRGRPDIAIHEETGHARLDKGSLVKERPEGTPWRAQVLAKTDQ